MCDTWNAWLNLIGLKMVNTVYIFQFKILLNLYETFNKFVFLQVLSWDSSLHHTGGPLAAASGTVL